jgi:hypothetical protein
MVKCSLCKKNFKARGFKTHATTKHRNREARALPLNGASSSSNSSRSGDNDVVCDVSEIDDGSSSDDDNDAVCDVSDIDDGPSSDEDEVSHDSSSDDDSVDDDINSDDDDENHQKRGSGSEDDSPAADEDGCYGEDSEGEVLYNAIEIMDERTLEDGKVEYQVRWEGYDDTTWEDEEHVDESMPDIVAKYRRNKKQPRKRKR